MRVLAVETSGALCGVAVRDERGTLVARAFRHRMRLSERLIGDVEAALTDAGMTLSEADGLAVGVGPGSFTGVRLGVMTMKTWADALGKPVAGVSALDALAEEYAGVAGRVIVPVVRARPGSVYARSYIWSDSRMTPLSEPALVPLAEIGAWLGDGVGRTCLLCGDGLERAGEELKVALNAAGWSVETAAAEAPRAAVVARIAAARLAAGEADDPLALAPLYLAAPPIDPRVEQRIAAGTRAGTRGATGE